MTAAPAQVNARAELPFPSIQDTTKSKQNCLLCNVDESSYHPMESMQPSQPCTLVLTHTRAGSKAALTIAALPLPSCIVTKRQFIKVD